MFLQTSLRDESIGTKHDGFWRSWNYDDVTSGFRLINLFGCTSPYLNNDTFSNVNRIFKTVLDDYFRFRKTIIWKVYFGSTHINLSGNDSSRRIQRYPNLWAWTKMKLWWRHCCFWWRRTFGPDLPFPKVYNISSVKFLSIASNYIKQLISRGYDVN